MFFLLFYTSMDNIINIMHANLIECESKMSSVFLRKTRHVMKTRTNFTYKTHHLSTTQKRVNEKHRKVSQKTQAPTTTTLRITVIKIFERVYHGVLWLIIRSSSRFKSGRTQCLLIKNSDLKVKYGCFVQAKRGIRVELCTCAVCATAKRISTLFYSNEKFYIHYSCSRWKYIMIDAKESVLYECVPPFSMVCCISLVFSFFSSVDKW